MKLIGFDEFCRMPAGTVFAPYEPCVLMDELSIKTDEGYEMSPDYKWCRHIFNGVMPLSPWLGGAEDKLWNIGDTCPASFEIYDGSSVDYMDYKMFLIFDETDIDRMINALVWAKNGCKGPIFKESKDVDLNDILEYVEKAFDRTPYESRWITENGEQISCDVGYAYEWWTDCMKPEFIRVFNKNKE